MTLPSLEEEPGTRRSPTVGSLGRWWPSRDERIFVVMRFALLIGGVLLATATGSLSRLQWSFVSLLLVAIVASVPARAARTPGAALVEAMAVVTIAAIPEPAGGPVLVYWLAPGLAAGMRGGYRWSLASTSLPLVAGVLLIAREQSDFDPPSLVSLVQWGVLSLGLGQMGAWIKSQERRAADPVAESYGEAVRLLTELEEISRRLPTGLDVGTMAQGLLEEMISLVPAERGAVVARDQSGEFIPVAGTPDTTGEWMPDDLDVEAWLLLSDSEEPLALGGSDGRSVVVPLRVGERLVGFVMLLQPSGDLDSVQVERVMKTAAQGAVPLEAALLFDAVRHLATSEERGRIAREIHDGIAQDIAFLGYAADEIVDVADEGPVHELALELRKQITRVVAELRMSVYAWREQAPTSHTLGTGISDYARRMFDTDEAKVHVVLDESARRLRPGIEAEVLRIAQEALTNARRHADAKNLWVTCRVASPHAVITIEDDGVGLTGQKRPDSFGLEIMSERARKINADLRFEPRPGGGTIVRLIL